MGMHNLKHSANERTHVTAVKVAVVLCVSRPKSKSFGTGNAEGEPSAKAKQMFLGLTSQCA
jgi:hypothetical protein